MTSCVIFYLFDLLLFNPIGSSISSYHHISNFHHYEHYDQWASMDNHVSKNFPSQALLYWHQWQPRLTISPLSLMAIFFFSPPLTSMEKECTRTPPVELLLFFMSSIFLWVCYSPYQGALIFTQDRRIAASSSTSIVSPLHVSELLHNSFNNA